MISEENARRANEDSRRALENAKRVGVAGQVAGQDQDFSAAEQMGQVAAMQGASGVTGASQAGVRGALERLAARDRTRIAMAGQEKAGAVRAQAGEFAAEATGYLNDANAARTDIDMTRVNTQAGVGASRLAAFGNLMGGGMQVGELFLDPRRTSVMRDSFNNLFRRRKA